MSSATFDSNKTRFVRDAHGAGLGHFVQARLLHQPNKKCSQGGAHPGEHWGTARRSMPQRRALTRFRLNLKFFQNDTLIEKRCVLSKMPNSVKA